MTMLVKDKTLAQAEELSQLLRSLLRGNELSDDELDLIGEMEALQGVRQFPIRVKCALLPWATLDDGIADFRSKAPPSP